MNNGQGLSPAPDILKMTNHHYRMQNLFEKYKNDFHKEYKPPPIKIET